MTKARHPDRPWRVKKSWDQFAIPRPFSRARCVVSPEIHVPAALDREGLEHYRAKVERLLNRLCDEAEAWAAAGTQKIGQFVLGHRCIRSCSHTPHTPVTLNGPHWRRKTQPPAEDPAR